MAAVQQISDAGASFIYKHESFVPHAYQDAAGNWTIGIGHLIRPNEQHLHNTVLSFTQAWVLFETDLEEFEGYVRHYVRAKLNQQQFDALVSLVYNIGPGTFTAGGASSLASLINNGASEEKIKAKWLSFNRANNGQVLNGLIKRRKEEWEMYSRKDVNWKLVGIGVGVGIALVLVYTYRKTLAELWKSLSQ